MTLWEISFWAESLISLSIAPHLCILSSKVLRNCLPDLMGVDVRNQGLFPNKELFLFNPTIHSWGIRINSICSNCFMSPGDIEDRVPGLEMLFNGEGTYGDSPLSGLFESISNGICTHPTKLEPIFIKVRRC